MKCHESIANIRVMARLAAMWRTGDVMCVAQIGEAVEGVLRGGA